MVIQGTQGSEMEEEDPRDSEAKPGQPVGIVG